MSIDLSVSVRGSIPTFSAAPAIARANERVAAVGMKAARIYAARHTKTGEMMRGLRSRARPGMVEWYDGAPQALFIEEGTRPHIIRPRRARALRWMGPSGPVFAKVVHHPGTRADPWLEPAINRSAPIFEGIYTDEVMGAFSRG